MSSGRLSDDAAPLLYLVPFLVSGIYGIYLWVKNGVSALLPTKVYLTVTRDPYIFIIGTLAVLLGVVLDVSSTDQATRTAKVKSVGDLLQSMAVASVVLSLICAFYSNGFAHLSETVTDFIVGRYTVIFPAMLVLLSYLITIKLRLESLGSPRLIGVILMLVSPAAVYEIGRRYTAAGVGIGLLLVIVGLFFFFRIGRTGKPASEG